MAMQGKARQCVAMQGKAVQGKARRCRARHGLVWHGKARRGKDGRALVPCFIFRMMPFLPLIILTKYTIVL